MTEQYFYIEPEKIGSTFFSPDEATTKHLLRVLRAKAGDSVLFTDGCGTLLQCKIADTQKNKINIAIEKKETLAPHKPKISIAVSLLKNIHRFEWMLEKATELGVTTIIPLICERTESKIFRQPRFEAIIRSAMLQSKQVWATSLAQPTQLKNFLENNFSNAQKFIAHCSDTEKNNLCQQLFSSPEIVVLIGPEGDFSDNEIKLALEKNFIPVSLGSTRLRTETAAVAVASFLKLREVI